MSNLECLVSLPYETRNLEVASFTVNDEFLLKPDFQILQSNIKAKENEFKSIFIQAKIKKDAIEVSFILQKCGFYFMEATVVPQSNLIKNAVLHQFVKNKSNFIPACYGQNDLNIQIANQNNTDVRKSIEKIASKSFTDDRFHLDPKCPNSSADIRFVNWVGDLYSDENVTFYTLGYKAENIAFMCRKDSHLILAGFDSSYRNSGLGDYLWLSVMQDMIEKKTIHANTLISVNNAAVLNLYARLGFKFKDTSMTYHYWS